MSGSERTDLQTLIDVSYSTAKKNGFWEAPPGIEIIKWSNLKRAEKIALMHSELSEALEAIRHPHESVKIPGFTSEEEEMADLAIRLFDYCGGFNIRLEEAIKAKMAYNTQRPYRHGKAF